MHLYRTDRGAVIERAGEFFQLPDADWDQLINRDDLATFLEARAAELEPDPDLGPGTPPEAIPQIRAPIGSQEVWAAGVTYYRSRDARIEESAAAGGGDFYARVYDAVRPELFFKATAHRVVGHGDRVRIRRDSRWNVPEPELALLITSSGAIVGYTVGNDVSSRDIEGENPLYLPQAKTYDGCCGLGPGILVTADPLPPTTTIRLEVRRNDATVIRGHTTLAQMKRSPRDLVEFLTRECSFPSGCILLTGTGIVPEETFSLEQDDEVRIAIDAVGTLVNRVI